LPILDSASGSFKSRCSLGFIHGANEVIRPLIIPGFLTLTVACAFTTPAMADGKLPWEGSGSGDWNGQRTHLDELGVTFWWIQDFTAQQNVSGGISKGGAAHNRSMLEVNYQFEPLTPLKGSEIQVSAGWNVGTNVQDFVGERLEGKSPNECPNFADEFIRCPTGNPNNNKDLVPRRVKWRLQGRDEHPRRNNRPRSMADSR
jgi:hypothetical protein